MDARLLSNSHAKANGAISQQKCPLFSRCFFRNRSLLSYSSGGLCKKPRRSGALVEVLLLFLKGFNYISSIFHPQITFTNETSFKVALRLVFDVHQPLSAPIGTSLGLICINFQLGCIYKLF
uniref:hypothetical protein n=1 Tax=Hafnia paralvei TaxID=546367 RepID=UPI0026DA73C0|nr:hypothetical protein [Hafnia paralvei]